VCHKIQRYSKGMTEVTTDNTNRNDRSVAVGGIGHYAAAWLVVSEFFTQ